MLLGSNEDLCACVLPEQSCPWCRADPRDGDTELIARILAEYDGKDYDSLEPLESLVYTGRALDKIIELDERKDYDDERRVEEPERGTSLNELLCDLEPGLEYTVHPA